MNADSTVRYTEKWNRQLMRPLGGYDWIDQDRARVLYAQRPGPGVVAVGGTTNEETGDFVPRWVLGFGTGPGVRVQFFDEMGTLTRLVDHDGIDGRLWRWVTVDYTYRDASRRWAQRECVQKVETTIRPDGTGYLTTHDKTDPASARPVVTTTEIDVPIKDIYWLDRPAFGDWDGLADPGPSAWDIAGHPVPAGR